jgi:hypothetical protein
LFLGFEKNAGGARDTQPHPGGQTARRKIIEDQECGFHIFQRQEDYTAFTGAEIRPHVRNRKARRICALDP